MLENWFCCLRVKKFWYCHLSGGFTVTAGSREECGSLQLFRAILLHFITKLIDCN